MYSRWNRSVLSRSAFTLIELLVVIAIVAVLLSIVVPTLSRAREEANKAVCMSNMRQIGVALQQYLGDHTAQNDNLPWTYVHTTLPSGEPQLYPGPPPVLLYSSYTWGGTRAPRPYQADVGYNADFLAVPCQLRPINRYLDPAARNKDPIKVTQCPGDRSAFSPTVGQGQLPIEEEGARRSYEAYGTSFSINWNFMFEPGLPMPHGGQLGFLKNLFFHGKNIIRSSVGGGAAEFVVLYENQADQLFVDATGTGGGRLGAGWHRKFSNHSFLFLDSHVEHKFFDTRYVRGPGWRVWRR